MEPMKRIPFGKETKLEIIATTCPGCNTPHGQFHEYGCVLESCPECHGRILKCGCMVLSMIDEMRLTKAIAKTLTSEDVHRMIENSTLLDQSYLEKAGVTFIILTASPQLEKEMEEMAFDILGAKKHGDHVLVPVDKAAEAMGMSREEAAPILQELEAECLYPDWQDQTGQKQ